MSFHSHHEESFFQRMWKTCCCCCFCSKKKCCGDSSSGENQPLIGRPSMDRMESFGNTFPEKNNGCFSSFMFSWITPLLELGNTRALEFDDLFQLNPSDNSTTITEKFEKAWKHQVDTKKKPSVFWALTSAFGGPFLFAGLLKFIHDALIFVAPIVLKDIIYFLSHAEVPLETGMYYVLALFLSNMIQSFCLRQYFFICFRTGMRCRSAVVTAVYQKSLKLCVASRQKKTTGEITNLMSVDAQRLQDLMPYLHGVWYGVLQIICSCILLWREMGVSCLGGIAVIVFMMPMTAIVAKFMKRLQSILMKVKDERTRLCYEILNGMKVIKLQAWEDSFEELVLKVRTKELVQLWKYIMLRAFSGTLFQTTPTLVAVATFVVYILLGNQLDVGTALTSLALFNILRFPLSMLPQVINSVVEAQVSFSRLTDFLVMEERIAIDGGDLEDVGVQVINADFRWEVTDKRETEKEFCLHNISLDVKNGELLAIVGHVGSGKSSLLSGILGDATCVNGEVYARGTVAYVSQQPFIQNATFRDNITFGKPYVKSRYDAAIKACALEPDLKILQYGSMTEIGEKGINLSGGQKTRVSLARAVYQDSDIYILDDPLAAVDGHVGKHIFEKCIKGLLKDKLVLFVSNGLSFLNQCDRIVVLKDGRIIEEGTYDQLLSSKQSFAALIDANAESSTLSPEKKRSGSHSSLDFSKVEEGTAAAIGEEVSSDKVLRSESSSSDQSATANTTGGGGGGGALISVEDRSSGDVSWSIYKSYVQAAGGICFGFWFLFGSIFGQFVQVCSTLWLSYWSENGENHSHSQMFYLYVFIGLNMGFFGLSYIRMIFLFSCGLVASRQLFVGLLDRVLKAPMSFFDTTPLGRIMNRMSKDIYTVDEQIVSTFNMYVNCVIVVVSTLIMVSSVTPLFLTLLLPICFGYYRSQRYFIKTSRELQRLDSISRSPIYALLNETLDGLPCIQAYGVESMFANKNQFALDKNQRAYYLNFSANCWLALRLEFAGTLIASGAALFGVLGRPEGGSESFAGLAGVALSYAISVTQTLNWSVRMASQLETEMVSVERIQEYSRMKIEAPFHVEPVYTPPVDWPQAGTIEFRDVCLRYRPDLPLVIRKISCTIRAQEKIGVVGRTGAGKSSLMVTLMRIVELESGTVRIDGVDIAAIGLHDLRSRISIIPQDPVLFSGTIRQNLDPFSLYSDDEIWQSINRAHLKTVFTSLDAPVSERGTNFSVGERQLLCIARSLLKKARVIIMDEATASIDVETDQLIQQSIREQFKGCTCITIAHRINTIMDSDRIMVMDNGQLAEFDTPELLMRKKGGLFQQLVQHFNVIDSE